MRHWSEGLAELHLRSKGLKVLAKNYYCRLGEIDLVTIDTSVRPPVLVFIEVKYRKSNRYGRPEEFISLQKQRRIILTARHYLQACFARGCTSDYEVRFDVIAIPHPNYLPSINWIKDAFS